MRYSRCHGGRSLKIAIIGPFDIENYGDHIFKQVLEYKISRAHPDVEFDTFAVTQGTMGFSGGKSRVFAIDELESRHKAKTYDSLLVAGGSIIHFETLIQVIRGAKEPYPLWKLWSQASRVAARYGIRLIWNNPEAPLDFEGWEVPVVRKFTQPVDFLSVRNSASRQALQKCITSDIQVGPDTGWLLRDVFNDALLAKACPPEVKGQKLVIFHCNQNLAEEFIPEVIELLEELQQDGATVVLLPLAYTNSEENKLRQIHTTANEQFTFIDRALALPEMVALFSQCELYVGLSFHGALTTACFGGEVIAIDYEDRRKTKELYSTMGKANNYTTDIKKAAVIARHLRKTKRGNATEQKVIQELQAETQQHFERLIPALTATHKQAKLDLDEEYSIADLEIGKRFTSAQRLQEISEGFQQCYDLYQALLSKQGN